MMRLTKIFSDDCDICRALGSSAQSVAEDNGFEYDEVELGTLARNPSNLKNYVVGYHVDEDGMIDLPIYVITTARGEIQGSSVVKELKEVANLVDAWKKWKGKQ